MLLQPKKFKFRKLKKRYLRNQLIETKSISLKNGSIGLKILESTRVTARQIEAIRQTITRALGRRGRVWIKPFPSIPVTKKPTENRMGKGKGSVDFWCSPIKAGFIIFEITGVSTKLAFNALKLGSTKLSVKSKIVYL